MDETDNLFYNLNDNPSLELVHETFRKFQRIVDEKMREIQGSNNSSGSDSSDMELEEYNDGSRYHGSVHNDD